MSLIGTTLRVTTSTDVYDVEVDAVTIVECERRFCAGIVEVFSSGRMEALWWVAWSSSVAAGRDVGKFKRWLRDLRGVEVDPE